MVLPMQHYTLTEPVLDLDSFDFDKVQPLHASEESLLLVSLMARALSPAI